eukprot:g5976.t1
MLMEFGYAFGGLGDAVKQEELRKRALVIKEAAYGPEHTESADGCEHMLCAARRLFPSTREIYALEMEAGHPDDWEGFEPRIIRLCKPKQDVIRCRGGIARVLAAARAHAQRPGVQASALAAVALLLMNNGASYTEFMGGGIIDLVIGAMRAHAKSEAVQRHGCEALVAILDAVVLKEISKVNAIDAAVNSGALATVLAAMRGCVASPRVQEQCCYALGSFFAYPVHHSRVVAELRDAGGVALLLGALRRHGNDRLFCMAFFHFADTAFDHGAIVCAFIDGGAIELMLGVARLFPDSVELTNRCSQELLRLLEHVQLAQGIDAALQLIDEIVGHGGLEVGCGALAAHPNCAALAGQACVYFFALLFYVNEDTTDEEGDGTTNDSTERHRAHTQRAMDAGLHSLVRSAKQVLLGADAEDEPKQLRRTPDGAPIMDLFDRATHIRPEGEQLDHLRDVADDLDQLLSNIS